MPSSITANAVTVGNGKLSLDTRANLLSNIPDFVADIELNSVDLTELNDFIKAYAKFDVQNGTFTLITEMAVEDKKISGYIKPFFENLDVFSLSVTVWNVFRNAFVDAIEKEFRRIAEVGNEQ